MPIFTKRQDSWALLATAMSWSMGSTIVTPMPMATPLMAATIGLDCRQSITQSVGRPRGRRRASTPAAAVRRLVGRLRSTRVELGLELALHVGSGAEARARPR